MKITQLTLLAALVMSANAFASTGGACKNADAKNRFENPARDKRIVASLTGSSGSTVVTPGAGGSDARR